MKRCAASGGTPSCCTAGAAIAVRDEDRRVTVAMGVNGVAHRVRNRPRPVVEFDGEAADVETIPAVGPAQRDDLAGECYITRKAHLKKQKGMPAGLWRIDQSESIFFRYNKTELDGILQTIQV